MKKSKIILIVLLILLTIGGIIGTRYYFYNSKAKQIAKEIDKISLQNKNCLIEYTSTFEYGDTLSLEKLTNNLVEKDKLYPNTEIKVFIGDEPLEKDYILNKIGKIDIKIVLSLDYRFNIKKNLNKLIEEEKLLEINVVDTKFPIIDGVSDKTITVGDTIDLKKGITAKDEIDGDLEIVVDGSVDTKKAGDYKINVSATDINGNKTEKEFKVTVKNKKTTSQGSTTKPSSSSSTSTDASTKAGRLNLAKAEAKRVVGEIIKSGMSESEKAQAISTYLYMNVDRQLNQSTEAYKTNYGNEAYAALIMKIAACSGFCRAVTLLCDAAGLQSEHINANQWTHQWNKVYADGKWQVLDAQLGYFGGDVHPFYGY